MNRIEFVKKWRKIIGAVGVLLLVSLWPLNNYLNSQPYTGLEHPSGQQILHPTDTSIAAGAPTKGQWERGPILLRAVVVDPASQRITHAWSEQLDWPQASNAVQRIQFEGRPASDKFEITIESIAWTRSKAAEQIPHWQRSELGLQHMAFTDFERDAKPTLRSRISYAYKYDTTGEGSGGRTIERDKFAAIAQLRSVSTTKIALPSSLRRNSVMVSIVPLFPGKENAVDTPVRTFMPTIVDELKRNNRAHVHHAIHLRHGANVPHGVRLLAHLHWVLLIGIFGVAYASGLFPKPSWAFTGLCFGLVLAFGLLDKIAVKKHLGLLVDTEQTIDTRLIAAQMAGRTFFHEQLVQEGVQKIVKSSRDSEPILANGLFSQPAILKAFELDKDEDYIDTDVLMHSMSVSEPTFVNNLRKWTETSPLRALYVDEKNPTPFADRVIISCTSNELASARSSGGSVSPIDRIALPTGFVLQQVSFEKKMCVLEFTLTSERSANFNLDYTLIHTASFKPEELFTDGHSRYNCMAFSAPDQPDPVRDYVNGLILLKRAGVKVGSRTETTREVVIRNRNIPLELHLDLPLNYLDAISSDHSIQVRGIRRRSNSIYNHLVIHVGDESRSPFRNPPGKPELIEDRKIPWRVYTQSKGKKNEQRYLHTTLEGPNGHTVRIQVQGVDDAERETLMKVCETMRMAAK